MGQSRTKARRSAVQALYQWQMTGQSVAEIKNQFQELSDVSTGQAGFFEELLFGVPRELKFIDKALSEFVDRDIEMIDPVERAVLRIGVYELLYRKDVPYRVVLNEGVNLARSFGASESHKYVNGVLDKIAHIHRLQEMS